MKSLARCLILFLLAPTLQAQAAAAAPSYRLPAAGSLFRAIDVLPLTLRYFPRV